MCTDAKKSCDGNHVKTMQFFKGVVQLKRKIVIIYSPSDCSKPVHQQLLCVCLCVP